MRYSTQAAAKHLLNKYPTLDIRLAKDYGDSYMFLAFDKTVGDSREIDPFYLVNKTTGAITPTTIATNPEKFYTSKELPLE